MLEVLFILNFLLIIFLLIGNRKQYKILIIMTKMYKVEKRRRECAEIMHYGEIVSKEITPSNVDQI